MDEDALLFGPSGMCRPFEAVDNFHERTEDIDMMVTASPSPRPPPPPPPELPGHLLPVFSPVEQNCPMSPLCSPPCDTPPPVHSSPPVTAKLLSSEEGYTRRLGKGASVPEKVWGPIAPRKWTAFIFMRLRLWKDEQWYEFLMEASRDRKAYRFPEASSFDPLEAVLNDVGHRGMLTPPRDTRDLEKFLQTELVIDDTTFRVYLLPMSVTQRPRLSRRLPCPPAMYWCAESELVRHAHIGPPSAFGIPIHSRCVAAMTRLPLELRFASDKPPLVMYHGTSAAVAAVACETGLFPSTEGGMLGPGVYFARIDKAEQFARENRDRIAREEPGAILRCYVFPKKGVYELTPEAICSCGCSKPFVDHNSAARRRAKADVAYVPDNAKGATRRAEWCVSDVSTIHIDGVFDARRHH